MKCPVCSAELKIADRQGIEIDYCPQCRGIWLDRGELDKIIERSASSQSAPYQNDTRQPDYEKYERDEREYRKYEDEYKDKYRHHDHYSKKKKKSFLDDIFDF